MKAPECGNTGPSEGCSLILREADAKEDDDEVGVSERMLAERESETRMKSGGKARGIL